jgi:hypothetical protein
MSKASNTEAEFGPVLVPLEEETGQIKIYLEDLSQQLLNYTFDTEPKGDNVTTDMVKYSDERTGIIWQYVVIMSKLILTSSLEYITKRCMAYKVFTQSQM